MNKQINFLSEPMEVKFLNFHNENKEVYELYKKYALELIESGRNKIGSKMIVERIRWETIIRTKGDIYKINNNYTCYYARLFIREFPRYADRFNFRQLRTY